MRGIVCYATEQGLGRQAKQFFDHGLVQEVFIWPHREYDNHYEWYPNSCATYDEMLDKVGEVWFLETPFDWNFVRKAQAKGVRTVLFLMYECSTLPIAVDQLVGGSIMERIAFGDTVKVITVPAPEDIKWRLRQKAQVFVHNAGHGGLGGRNGTTELLEAMRYVKSPIKLIIRTQLDRYKSNDPRVEIRVGDFEYNTLFDEGDVYIYPDKFGGSCLPLQEAHSAGMLVMATDRLPSNTWLPIEPLIPVAGYKKERVAQYQFDTAIVDPRDIAKKIDAWYNADITKFSLIGKQWAEDNSWEALKSEYEKI